ncbi:MAG: hypothetical protein QUV02_00360 [Maricaulis sp.]|uniref:hypothetical protein n=1 Tax=Maricaulis sp. TaxID=1486257 RepID=UPI00261E368E|nr:hypothetical protein [Maricaulis sp.]MDM7982875.1 hypothetical protein [Maricaulis sp.]
MKVVLGIAAGFIIGGLSGIYLGGAINQGILDTYYRISFRDLESEIQARRELALALAANDNDREAHQLYLSLRDETADEVDGFLMSPYLAVRFEGDRLVEICSYIRYENEGEDCAALEEQL